MKKEYIIYKLSESIKSTSRIDNELFTKYNVKRGCATKTIRACWWD